MTILDPATATGYDGSPDPTEHGTTPSGQAGRLARRRWPMAITVVFVGLGTVFMLFWNVLLHHGQSWATGGDLWGIFQAAHYVEWGSLGGVYAPGNGVVAFPGMAVLLAPIAMVTGHFHMTEPWGPFTVLRPTAALVLVPVELLLGSTVIFASDALAERLRVPARRRFWLCIVVAVVAWPTVAIWGHAEDALAITFALYAMAAMLDRKWARMGWLFGLGVVMQPLVALMVPLFIGATPQGKRLMLAVRSALFSAFLVGVAFLGNASDTYRAVVKQPTPPSVNHATPWAALAPKLTTDAVQTIHYAKLSLGHGRPSLAASTASAREVVMVSGGAGRMIDVVLAILVGFYVWRRPQPTVRLLWLAAAVLVSRCFFEPVMTPYYLAPPLFLCLVMVSRQRGKRFWPAVVIALEITVFAYHHLNPWVWWLTVVAGLGTILALGYPGDLNGSPDASAPVSDARAGLDDDSSFDESEVVEGEREPVLL